MINLIIYIYYLTLLSLIITKCKIIMRCIKFLWTLILRISINDKYKFGTHVLSFFYALLLSVTKPMYFLSRIAWYFSVTHRALFTRLLFLQYPRVTHQFSLLLWRTVSQRYWVKNILVHEQGTPPRDITITTHLVTREPENPLICRCRQAKLRGMKHFCGRCVIYSLNE